MVTVPRREGGGERRSFGTGGDRKPPYSGGGDRDRKPYGDRAPREGGGERRSFGTGGGDRKPPYSGGGVTATASPMVIVPRVRAAGSAAASCGGGSSAVQRWRRRDRKPYGDRAPREGGGERRSFGTGERKPP